MSSAVGYGLSSRISDSLTLEIDGASRDSARTYGKSGPTPGRPPRACEHAHYAALNRASQPM
jgi:hypothetical protein